MIVVTGGAGFIGAKLLEALEAGGEADLLVAEDLERCDHLQNLEGRRILDLVDRRRLLSALEGRPRPRAVLHQGACTDTAATGVDRYLATLDETDGRIG